MKVVSRIENSRTLRGNCDLVRGQNSNDIDVHVSTIAFTFFFLLLFMYHHIQASVSGTGGFLGGLSSVVPWLLSFTSTAQVDTEKWDTVHQPISTREERVDIYLQEDDTLAHLEAIASAGTDTRRPRVRVDIAGAEFFSMEEVDAVFEADKTPATVASSRTQLGYRTTEEVRRALLFVVVVACCCCWYCWCWW